MKLPVIQAVLHNNLKMEDRRNSWTRGLHAVVNSKKINAIFLGAVLSIVLHKVGLNSEIQFMYALAIMGAVGVQGYRDVKTPKDPNE